MKRKPILWILLCLIMVVSSSALFNNDEFYTYIFAGANPNILYAEMYLFNESGQSFSIPSFNVYYNLSYVTQGDIYLFNFSDGYLTANKEGIYEINYAISFSGVGGHTLGFVVFKNETLVPECYGIRKLGSAGDVGNAGGVCILNLSTGEYINFRIEDENNPSADINIFTFDLSIFALEGLGSRTVLENNSYYFNTTYNNTINNTINQTINTTINNTYNTTFYNSRWVNYTDPIINENYTFPNKSYADHILVQHIAQEGYFANDFNQFWQVQPALWNYSVKRLPGLDEIFGRSYYQCRGENNQECPSFVNRTAYDLSKTLLSNITFVPVPSMQWSDSGAMGTASFNKHREETIFYDNEMISEPVGVGIVSTLQMFKYSYTFQYVRAYQSKPEVQCSCEVQEGQETDLWDEAGGFMVCELRNVNNISATGVCKLYFSPDPEPLLPTAPYYIHISSRWWEVTDSEVDPIQNNIYIEWNTTNERLS